MGFYRSISTEKGPSYMAGYATGQFALACLIATKLVELGLDDNTIIMLLCHDIDAFLFAKRLESDLSRYAEDMLEPRMNRILSDAYGKIIAQSTIDEMAKKECAELMEWVCTPQFFHEHSKDSLHKAKEPGSE